MIRFHHGLYRERASVCFAIWMSKRKIKDCFSASKAASGIGERRIMLYVWRLEDMPGKERVFNHFRICTSIFDEVLVLLGRSPAFQNTEMRKLGLPKR